MADLAEDDTVQEHWIPDERDPFEVKVGVTYCRRCGRPLAMDKRPDFVQSKPCRVVRVELR